MNANQLRASILQMAIEGKLVPQIDSEPAVEQLGNAPEDVPFDIPEKWKWVYLSNVGRWKSGGTPDRSKKEYYDNGNIPWLKTGDLNDGFINSVDECITQLGLDNSSAHINPTGSVLIAMYGATIGKLGILNIPCATNQACCACVTEEKIIFNKFLFYYLLSQRRNLIALGAGSGQPNISKTKIINYLIALPPLEEQKRIVAKLEQLLPLVDEYGKAYEKLEELNAEFPDKLKASVLQNAIEGKLVPQYSHEAPATELLEEINVKMHSLISSSDISLKKRKNKNDSFDRLDTPYELPNGWVWCTLNDLAFYKKGPFGSSLTKSMFVPDGSDSYKVYEQKNAIKKNAELGTYFISKSKFESMKGFEVKPHDIIVSCAGTIGETYMLPQNIRPGIINQALMIIRLYNKDISDFFLLYFDFVLKSLANTNSKGTAIKNIPPFNVLKQFYFPLPPLEEQKRIVAKVEELFALIDAMKK